MNWTRIYFIAWQGISAGVIAFGTAVGVLQAWPNKLQWLILISGSAIAFCKGIDAYLRDGSGK